MFTISVILAIILLCTWLAKEYKKYKRKEFVIQSDPLFKEDPEIEMNEKKERVKDAVEATKAAIEEGVVPGGGVALLRARAMLVKNSGKELSHLKEEMNWRNFETAGKGIIYSVLSAPLMGIVTNAKANADWILREVEKSANVNWGYNVKSMKFGDMLAMGVLDPAKVVRLALQNAASVAGMVLTTDVLVTDIPEKEKMPGMSGGMGGMGGMPEM